MWSVFRISIHPFPQHRWREEFTPGMSRGNVFAVHTWQRWTRKNTQWINIRIMFTHRLLKAAQVVFHHFSGVHTQQREEQQHHHTAWGLVSQHTESAGDLQFSSMWYPTCQGFLPLFYFRFDLCDTRSGISLGQSQPVRSKEALANAVTGPVWWIPLCWQTRVFSCRTLREGKAGQCDMKLERAAVFEDTSFEAFHPDFRLIVLLLIPVIWYQHLTVVICYMQL